MISSPAKLRPLASAATGRVGASAHALGAIGIEQRVDRAVDEDLALGPPADLGEHALRLAERVAEQDRGPARAAALPSHQASSSAITRSSGSQR